MGNFELHVERADACVVAGWAFDRHKPGRHVSLALYDGGTHLVSFRADQFREDLAAVKIGEGDHGFHVRLPEYLIENDLLELRLVDPLSGTCLYEAAVAKSEAKVIAARSLLLDKVPRDLRSMEDPRERRRWAEAYLPLILAGATIAYQELRSAASAIRLEPTKTAPLDLTGVPFERVVAGLLAKYPILDLPDEKSPKVSIIIPVYNKFDYTYDCIKSLLATSNLVSYEVIIIDDSSTDETLMSPFLFQNAQVLRNVHNQGFLRNCNRGAAVARGEYLYFLNNDTKLTDHAIDALIDTFTTHDRVGLAGSKLLFGDGKLQEAGGIIWRLGDGWNYGRGDDPDDPRYNYVRDIDYVSGASIVVPAALFRELGGFDEHYVPAYYEDSDLAFRIRAAGYRTLYQPRSVIYHFEGISSGTDVTQGAKRYQVVNAKKFYTRWKDTLQAHALNGVRPEFEKDRGRSFRALFVDETTPTPDEDAGSNAAVTHMRAMQQLGGKVTFVPADNMSFLGAPSQALRDAGIEFLHHPYYWSLEELLRKRRDEFDVIYLHRLGVATRHLATCRALAPKARIVYNVADLHFLRLERGLALGAEPQLDAAAIEAIRTRELAAARDADAVIVHSAVEAALLRQHGVEHVFVVPWVISPPVSERGFEARSGCLFVGGFGHQPNVDAVEWFVFDVWPLVRAEVKDATFSVVGSHMPPRITQLGRVEGVRCLGFVKDLGPLYDTHRLTVAPLRYGAGLKGKVAQSLAYGVPCVGTKVAFEGFDPATVASLTAESAEDFAAGVIQFHTDKHAWTMARTAGLRYAAKTFSAEAVREVIADAIERGNRQGEGDT